MSAYVIVGTLVLIAIGLGVFSQMGSYKEGYTPPSKWAASILAVVFLMFAGVTVSVALARNMHSMAERSALEAFYNDTIDSYEHTVLATGEIEISAAQPGLIDAAYFGQAEVVAATIIDLRDEISWYNRRLAWFRTFNGMWLADGFIADISSDLQPIHLTDLDKVPGSE